VDEQPPVVGTPERDVARDIVRRGIVAAPVIVLAGGLIGGWDGAASAAVGVAIILVNFLAAAAIITRAAHSGPAAVGVAVLSGYVIRLGVILGALFALRDLSWVNLPILGCTMVGTHLGLLFWESKYVSLSLAAPGLRPARPGSTGE